jgi:hypothetical protein
MRARYLCGERELHLPVHVAQVRLGLMNVVALVLVAAVVLSTLNVAVAALSFPEVVESTKERSAIN